MSKPATIHELIASWNPILEKKLAPCFPCRDDTIVLRLLHYEELIKPNFVPWMARTWVGCQSEIARAVCASNLLCEISEDHPAMLTRYIDQADSRPIRYAKWKNLRRAHSVNRLDQVIVPDCAITGLIVMMLLENASLVFIPEMRRWGNMLGFTDFEYVDKHGVADINHANEFVLAVEAEIKELNFDLEHIIENHSEDVELVTDLLLAIFEDE